MSGNNIKPVRYRCHRRALSARRYKTVRHRIPLCADGDKYTVCTAVPILAEGDVLGCVVLAAAGEGRCEPSDLALAQTMATFLGKHMEA